MWLDFSIKRSRKQRNKTTVFAIVSLFFNIFILPYILFEFNLLSVPYDWRAPLGFLFTTIMQILLVVLMVMCFVCFIMLYVGICRFLIAFATEVQHTLNEFSNSFTESKKKLKLPKVLELKTKLNETVKFHSDALK